MPPDDDDSHHLPDYETAIKMQITSISVNIPLINPRPESLNSDEAERGIRLEDDRVGEEEDESVVGFLRLLLVRLGERERALR